MNRTQNNKIIKLSIQGSQKISIECLEKLLNSPQIFDSIEELDISFTQISEKVLLNFLTPSNLLRLKNLIISECRYLSPRFFHQLFD